MNKRKVIHLRERNTYEKVLQMWIDRGYKVENLALSSCCTQYGTVVFADLVAVLVEEEQKSDET